VERNSAAPEETLKIKMRHAGETCGLREREPFPLKKRQRQFRPQFIFAEICRLQDFV